MDIDYFTGGGGAIHRPILRQEQTYYPGYRLKPKYLKEIK